MIIAVDFDSTLSLGVRYPEIGEPNIPLFKWLIDKQAHGDTIVLWTCRGYDSHLQEAVDFCKSYGLTFDAVNQNPQQITFDSRKIVADMYIDDNAYPPDVYKYK